MKRTILRLSNGDNCWVGKSYDDFVAQNLDKEGNFKEKVFNIVKDVDGVRKRTILITSQIVSIDEE